VRARLLALGLVFSITACESGVDGGGRIVVPRSVLALFDAQKPGQVVLQAQIPNVGVEVSRLGILCGDVGADRAFPVRLFDFGCAVAGQVKVEAWAAPVTLKRPGCSDQSEAPDLYTPDVPPPNPVAFAEQLTPVNVHSGLAACHDGSFTVDLALAPLGM
jgi:hypothetical protein